MSVEYVITCVVGFLLVVYLMYPAILKKKEKKDEPSNELKNRRVSDKKISTLKVIEKDPYDRRVNNNPFYGRRDTEKLKRKLDFQPKSEQDEKELYKILKAKYEREINEIK